MNAAVKCHRAERWAPKNVSVSSSTHSADLTLLARPKVKMMAKRQCLEWSQDTKAATIAQLKTEEKDSRATVESGQKID